MTAGKTVFRKLRALIMRTLPGMLTCRELEGFMVDYLEDTLPKGQRRKFDRHLRLCRDCRRYLEAYKGTRSRACALLPLETRRHWETTVMAYSEVDKVIGLFRSALVSARRIVTVVSFCALAGTPAVLAQQSSAENVPDAEKALVERIKKEVLRDLMQEGALDAQINAGIERYIAKQRTAQAAARDRQEQRAAAIAKNVRPVSPQRDHIYGNPNAEVSLIEYSDFECPFCKRFHSTAKEVVDSFDGRVNWVYRHFPLAFHNPGAQKQAEASECASALGGNEAFWRYADGIYERTKSNGSGFPLDNLALLANEIGLDGKKFQACLESGQHTARVKEDFIEGTQIGISGTPGNIILNNETGAVKLKPGAIPLAVLKAEIDKLLK